MCNPNGKMSTHFFYVCHISLNINNPKRICIYSVTCYALFFSFLNQNQWIRNGIFGLSNGYNQTISDGAREKRTWANISIIQKYMYASTKLMWFILSHEFQLLIYLVAFEVNVKRSFEFPKNEWRWFDWPFHPSNVKYIWIDDIGSAFAICGVRKCRKLINIIHFEQRIFRN